MAQLAIPLSLEEQAATGFTHKSIITYADVAAISGATTSGAIAIHPYTAGTVFQAAAYKLVTPFDGGATSALALDVGHNGASTDDPDSLLDNYQIHADGTEVLYGLGNGANFATLLTGYAALDAGNIEATFTASDGNLSALTTGEVHIYLKAVDLTKY
jgi:hypothetical protein